LSSGATWLRGGYFSPVVQVISMLFTKPAKQLRGTHDWLAVPACQNFASKNYIVFKHLHRGAAGRPLAHKVFIRHGMVRLGDLRKLSAF
jgi:hypothetical protein